MPDNIMYLIIEGIDGAGKSSVIQGLASGLVDFEIADIKTLWETLKAQGKLKTLSERKQFFKDYFSTRKNKNLIVDRFHLSEIVYGKTLRGKNLNIQQYEKEIFGNNIDNVVMVLIDTDADEAQKRIEARDGKPYPQDLSEERMLFIINHNKSIIRKKYIVTNIDLESTIKSVRGFIDYVRRLS